MGVTAKATYSNYIFMGAEAWKRLPSGWSQFCVWCPPMRWSPPPLPWARSIPMDGNWDWKGEAMWSCRICLRCGWASSMISTKTRSAPVKNLPSAGAVWKVGPLCRISNRYLQRLCDSGEDRNKLIFLTNSYHSQQKHRRTQSLLARENGVAGSLFCCFYLIDALCWRRHHQIQRNMLIEDTQKTVLYT